MITFKEFIAEGFSSDFRSKLADLKNDIAQDMGERRYRVHIDRRMGMGSDYGMHVNIAIPVPLDHADSQDFFEKMVVLSAKKALTKHFDRFHIDSIDNISWNDGRAIYLIIQVPDADGLM